MSKKNKKNCDTREFTALKQTDRKGKKQEDRSLQSEQMRLTDRDQKPSFEV